MLILALDCSTARGSVAIGRTSRADDNAGGITVLREWSFPAGRGHGGELFSTLEEALRLAKREVASVEHGQLERIVAGLGPGSYSGVRQSIAVATGLGLSSGAALVGLPSTLALETAAAEYHAIGDARRGTFYYTAVVHGSVLEGPDLVDDLDALQSRLALRPEWPVLAVENVPVALAAGVEAVPALPRAARLLTISPALHQHGLLEPIYLRPVSVTMPKEKVEGRR